MKKNVIKSKTGYSREAQSWVRKLTAGKKLKPTEELLARVVIPSAYDRMMDARTTLAKEGAVVTDRFQQPRPHPSVQIESRAREDLSDALKSLGVRRIFSNTGSAFMKFEPFRFENPDAGEEAEE